MIRNFLLFTFCIFLTTAISAQEYIWGGPLDSNSTFAGGLNDWTNNAISPNANAVWTWTADGAMSNGAFWGARDPIESPSAANGAAGFNSDFLDNDGNSMNIGGGVAPAPQASELISPTMDCTGESAVFLEFYQYFREFNTDALSVGVSSDNGMTWDTLIPINENIPTNQELSGENHQIFDISPWAANNPNVKIKFVWEGEYYFWIVDDVSLIRQPRHNLVMGDFFYPPASYATPVTQIATDSFGFSADISNMGSEDQTNVTLYARVFQLPSLNLLYIDSLVVPVLPAGTIDSNFATPNLWAPALPTGDYLINYIVFADSVDYNLTDNDNIDLSIFRSDFTVTTDQFAKEDDIQIGFQPGGGGDYYAANLYQMSPASIDTHEVVDVTFSASSGATPIEGRNVTIYLLEVSDNVDAGFNNFDINDDFLTNSDLTIIAVGSYTYTANDASFDEITTTFDDPALLLPGKRYFLMTEYIDANNIMFQSYDQTREYFQISSITYSTQWFLGGFGAENSAVIRMQIKPYVVNTDETPLPEASVQVFPNPTQDYVRMAVEFDEATKATVSVLDNAGHVIQLYNYPALVNETLEYDVSHLASGAYMLRIATEKGSATKRFVIQK